MSCPFISLKCLLIERSNRFSAHADSSKRRPSMEMGATHGQNKGPECHQHISQVSWNLAGWSRWTQPHKTGPCPCHDLVQIALFTPKCAATTTFEPPKETHNKTISENSPNIFRIKYGTPKKMQGLCMYNRSVQLKVLLKN